MKKASLFAQAKELLGFDVGNLVSCVHIPKPNPENLTEISEWLALERAKSLQASYVYFRRFEDRPSQAQLYVYDFSDTIALPDEHTLGNIQKDVWSSGEVPCMFVFTKDAVSIINTSEQPKNEEGVFLPTYLIETSSHINAEIQQRFSHLRLDSGTFLQEEQAHFAFSKSAHKTLLDKLRVVREAFLGKKILPPDLVNRLLIQCVLVRYLEEKQGTDAHGIVHKVFPNEFFQQVAQANSFRESLEKGTFVSVFDKLNNKDHLNGKIFEWSDDEKAHLKSIPTSTLVDLLYRTDTLPGGQMALWDLYSFRYLPVEVVSSIYEALFTSTEEVKENGMVYTPPHLAAFLVDEAMPLTAWRDKADYLVCDPSCGSGVFLVLAFRRLVHWWRLRHEGAAPSVADLTTILSTHLYGIDQNPNAVLLTRFSLCLAVCDMLTPPEIWDKFHFPDLTDRLVVKDFFVWQQENQGKASFDLLIGNPPFKQATKNLPDWTKISDVEIPQKQIALYFLCAGMKMVKPSGLLCLLLKSSSFLYTTSGRNFRTDFLVKYRVHQVLDFTLLARNHVLWPNEEPDTAALFASNEQPNAEDKVLHVVVKRTSATRIKRRFEIDAYDFHWVPYSVALEDDFVWKCNLLGGGRLYNTIHRLKAFPTLKQFADANKWAASVGYRTSDDPTKPKSYKITGRLTLPTEWLSENGIERFDFKPELSEYFYQTGNERIYDAPHIVIKSNIGDEHSIPMWNFQDLDIAFKDGIIGIASPKNEKEKLSEVYEKLKKYNDLYRGYLFSTSPKTLVYMNTVVLAKDIYNLPFPENLETEIVLSKPEKRTLNDVLKYYQDFIRRPESANAYQPITSKNFQTHFTQFGTLFCESLNAIYAKNGKRFRQAEAGYFHSKEFIYTTFRYDDLAETDISKYGDDAPEMTKETLSELLTLDKGHVRFQRILKIYKKDYVCFIKPNQLCYWLDSIALRDADGVLADLVKQGY